MAIDTTYLEQQGWSQEELRHAHRVAKEAERQREPWVDHLERNMHWLYLGGAVVANLTLPIALLPVFVAVTDSHLLLLTAILGLVFGGIATAVFHQLDRIDKKHHVLYIIFIFTTGLVGFSFVLTWANTLVAQAGFGYQHSVVTALVYLAAFLTPYGVWRMIR